MYVDGQVLTDTRDIVAVHALSDVRLAMRRVNSLRLGIGDAQRARQPCRLFAEVLWLIGAHHAGEDEPVPTPGSACSQGARTTREDGSAARGDIVKPRGSRTGDAKVRDIRVRVDDGHADACKTLLERPTAHLDHEEEYVLPIASRLVTPPEWGALPAHTLSHYPGTPRVVGIRACP